VLFCKNFQKKSTYFLGDRMYQNIFGNYYNTKQYEYNTKLMLLACVVFFAKGRKLDKAVCGAVFQSTKQQE